MQRREQQRILEKLAEAREARARAMKRFAQAQERVEQVEARLQAARERLKAAQATRAPAQEAGQTSKQPESLAHENGTTTTSSGVNEQANAQSLVADTSAVQDTSDTDITTKIPVIRQARQNREQT